MIRFSCTCGKERQVPDMFAGRNVKCPDCGVVTVVPAAGAPPAPAAVPAPPAAGMTEFEPPQGFAPSAVELLTQERFASAKSDSRRLRLHLPFTSLSGAALLVAFFCLPWLRMSCANIVIGEPTGYNLATNTQDSRTRTLEEKSKKASASNPLLQGMDISRLTVEAEEKEKAKDPPWGGKSLELWTFPALGLLLLLWGLLRIVMPSYSIGRETVILLTLVLGCGTLLLYERLTWYRKPTLQKFTEEMRKAMETPGSKSSPVAGMLSEADRKELLDYFGITDQPGFWLTVIALCGAAFSMTAWLAFPSSKAG